MARVRWHGSTFRAEPIEQIDATTWRMRALEHGARVTVGTEIIVKQNEIVEMAAAEAPPDPAASINALEAALAKERETLPSIVELLKAAKDNPNGPPQG